MITSCPKCSNEVPMKSLLTARPIVCSFCQAKLVATSGSSILLSVLSLAIGTWIFGMLKDAGFVPWAPFLFAPLSVALCGVLLSPIILRLREVDSESKSPKQ